MNNWTDGDLDWSQRRANLERNSRPGYDGDGHFSLI